MATDAGEHKWAVGALEGSQVRMRLEFQNGMTIDLVEDAEDADKLAEAIKKAARESRG